MPNYLLLLVCFCLLGAAVALGQRPAVPGTARQAAQPTPENTPRGAALAGRRYQVRTGAVVLGWYPEGLPARAYEQMDFSLLSHLTYGGYRATDQGHLERPAHPLAEARATVRHANPSCQVLLSVAYQEAQSGPGLFAKAQLPAQQLAVAIVRELATTRADGVNLEFVFQAAASLAAKYAWVARQHLSGVGIMALGYDNPSTLAWPLWQAGLAKVVALSSKAAPQSTLEAGVHVGLFAGATLLGFAFLGGLISALLHAPAIIPFRSRLLKVGLLLGGCLVLLLLYSYFLGAQHGRPLLVTCLAGLGTLATGIGYHRLRQPRQLP